MIGWCTASRPDVSVIIVSFNTRALLQDCLHALLQTGGVSLEVFVVDNASHDGSADMVARQFPRVRLVRSPYNRGFAAANNVAIPASRGRNVLLLNPDALVRPETIAALAGFLDAHPDVGITGPRVLNESGTVQSCGYWYPTLLREIRLSRNVNRLLRMILGDERPAPDPSVPTDVDWLDGCCLMIRRSVIEHIGLLDEQYFLYAEELDWCRTAANAGWRIVTCPPAEVVHLQGMSTGQVSARALALLIETRLRYYHKHDGLLRALLVSVVYVAGCFKRWHLEPEKSHAKLNGVTLWWQSLRRARPRVRMARIATPSTGAPAQSRR